MSEKIVKFGVKSLMENTMAQGRMISGDHFSNFYLMDKVKSRVKTPSGTVLKLRDRENPHFNYQLAYFGDRPERFLLDAQGKKLYKTLTGKKKKADKKKEEQQKEEDTKETPKKEKSEANK